MKVLIHVQHLLGIGHAVRAAAIGRALRDRGVKVTLASGNRLPEVIDTTGLDVVELPAARAAGSMRRMRGPRTRERSGARASAAGRAAGLPHTSGRP